MRGRDESAREFLGIFLDAGARAAAQKTEIYRDAHNFTMTYDYDDDNKPSACLFFGALLYY